jgi:hypothetical protein
VRNGRIQMCPVPKMMICPSSQIVLYDDDGDDGAGPSKEVLARTYANIRAVGIQVNIQYVKHKIHERT